jgi:hypothetical protein
MFSCYPPKEVNIKRFKKKYNDKRLLFFRDRFLEAKILFFNVLPILEECVRENNVKEWNKCINSIKNISDNLCFTRLSKQKNKQTPNLEDFNKIKERFNALREFKYNL